MKIEIDYLKTILNKLLDHTKEIEGDSIHIDEDLYWFIQKEGLCNPEQEEPQEFTLDSFRRKGRS